MEQKQFDFTDPQSHPLFLQLETTLRQGLIEQMSQIISVVFLAQDTPQNEQVPATEQNKN